MILWKFTVREVKNRPGRATLTLLSIVIGVAAVVAVTVGTATTNQACQEMYSTLTGRAALEVVAAGGGAFDESTAGLVEKTPGVKAAIPSIQKVTSLRHKGNNVKLLAMGMDPEREGAARDYELKEGRFFNESREALLEAGFAEGLGVHVGDQVKVGTMRGLHGSITPFRIVGLLAPRGAAGFNQGGVIFLPLTTAQELFASKPGSIDTVSVVLDDGANEKTVAAAIAGRLPAGLSVRSPQARAQLSKETIEQVSQGMLYANVTMIVLATFMILNTFLMNVGERRRQLAVLRAIGATRRQITRTLLLEGLMMGALGTLLGSMAGLGGAHVLAQSMGKVYSTAMPALRISPLPFALAGLLGPAVSLLAMFVPAWIAGRVSPLEGMRFVVAEGRNFVTVRYVLVAIAIFAITAGLMAASLVGYLPIEWMIVTGVIFTVAFALLIPMLLNSLTWLAGFLLRPILGTEGRIAQRQILRRRIRTTLTIFILYVAVSTAISLGTSILNNVDDIHQWVATAMKGDFFVRRLRQDMGSGLAAKMPESLVNDLRAIDGVSNIDSIRWISGSILTSTAEGGKQPVTVFVRDFTDKGNLPLVIKSGDAATVREELAKGKVVLGTTLASRLHVGVGDKIKLETRQGSTDLTVAATTTAYMVGGMIVYMEGKTARELLNADGVDAYVVNAAAGSLDSVKTQLKTICDRGGLMLDSFADVRRRVDGMMGGLIASLWGLLALGLIVGAFGIANTLTMNVLEQTRELALLRVVAMTRRQVRKTILSQAAIIGIIGLVMGIGGGLIGAYIINLASMPLMGYQPAFTVHLSLMGICFGLGLVVILAAAWLPAARAARLNLLIALQYE
ncbi:MAG: ABC transporter permease [Planctomycetaceae bacterium]|nr:ABC transporter permease [Planctomycetaceae bacterium]